MSQQPVPVEPLNYYPDGHHSGQPILKAAAVAAMALGTGQVIYLLCQLLAAGMGMGMTGFSFPNLAGFFLEALKGVAGGMMIVFGFQCMRRAASARRSLIIAIGAAVILSIVAAGWSLISLYSLIVRPGTPAMLLPARFAMMLASIMNGMVLPILLIWILTRSEVKEIFRDAQP